jgi:hypothetical protein
MKANHSKVPGQRERAVEPSALDHATQIVRSVCQLVGGNALLDELVDAEDLALAIRSRNSAALFDWLVAALSYQGISDEVAKSFMDDPLREVYGVSDKVLMMALSQLLLGAPRSRQRWREVGGAMIAIDTLVHNFLHRTGILRRFDAAHAYGPACYQPGGCAEIVETVAGEIDASQFDRRFPKTFPRFVQYAIWRYCSKQGFDICNGNQIDDRKPCENTQCELYPRCDRITLGVSKISRIHSNI